MNRPTTPAAAKPSVTMRNLHRLRPCAACPTRMAVPGSPVCTTCEAETVNALIADLPRQPTPKDRP